MNKRRLGRLCCGSRRFASNEAAARAIKRIVASTPDMYAISSPLPLLPRHCSAPDCAAEGKRSGGVTKPARKQVASVCGLFRDLLDYRAPVGSARRSCR